MHEFLKKCSTMLLSENVYSLSSFVPIVSLISLSTVKVSTELTKASSFDLCDFVIFCVVLRVATLNMDED